MSLKVSHDPLDHKSLSHTHTYTEGGGNQSIRRKPPTVCPVNGCHREMHGRMKIRTKDTQFLLSLSHLSPSISHAFMNHEYYKNILSESFRTNIFLHY